MKLAPRSVITRIVFARIGLAVFVGGWLAAGMLAVNGCGSLRSKLGTTDGGTGGASAGGRAGTGGSGGASGSGGAGTGAADASVDGGGVVDAPLDVPDVPAGSGGATAGTGGAAAGTGGATVGTGGTAATGGRGGSAGAGGRGGTAGTAATGGRGGTGGTGSGGSAPGSGGTPGAVNGTACTLPGQCVSGNCVDGYCCNDACAGLCEACDVPMQLGTCSFLQPGTQPHGTRAKCNGTGACAGSCNGLLRKVCAYPSGETPCRAQSCTASVRTQAAVCGGNGACGPVVTMNCAQGCSGTDCLGACTSNLDCVSAVGRPYCDTTTGMCTTLKPNGQTCTTAADCTSNHCADGYCCNSDCTDQCSSCKEMGALGDCRRVTGNPRTGGTPARTTCAGSAPCAGRCDGQASTCQYDGSGTSCGTGASCTAGTMTPAGACNGAGSCAQPAPFTCGTNYCVTATSCGACASDGECGAGRWCNGGTCTAKSGNGVACSAAGQCTSGNCVTNMGATGSVCCAGACGGATPRCNAAGSACVCTCGAGMVCRADTGACCTRNACATYNCRDVPCDPGCGLTVIPRNCNCTSTGCCGGPMGQCCVTVNCSGTICTSPVTTCQ